MLQVAAWNDPNARQMQGAESLGMWLFKMLLLYRLHKHCNQGRLLKDRGKHYDDNQRWNVNWHAYSEWNTNPHPRE